MAKMLEFFPTINNFSILNKVTKFFYIKELKNYNIN